MTTHSTPDRSPSRSGDTARQVFDSAELDGELGDEATLPFLGAPLAKARGEQARLGRFRVLRRIGIGGMGVVYEALDPELGDRVALKTLRYLGPANLYRFKHEFRALASVSHPNLVVLHELERDGAAWFYTMELVDGVSFAEHAHEGPRPPSLGATVRLDDPGPESAGAAPPRPEARPGFREEALRCALRGLAEGVAALHSLGLVHRDLNSSNVLVTPEGRAVVLDFGLVTEARCGRPPRGPFAGISGTPAYMSPEQAVGKDATPASDWYALGVMLFEALTGRLPFPGPAVRVLDAKQRAPAPLPSTLAAGVPDDLDALCAGLLRRRPEERPTGGEVLRSLGLALPRPLRAPPDAPLHGRRAALDRLRATLRVGRPGRAAVARVEGPSGVGKTALCERFAAEAAREGAVILGASSAPRERVAHRTLDAVVDALALHLASLPGHEADALLPPDIRSLSALFPVLDGVPGVAQRPAPSAAAEPLGLSVLGELLERLSERRPVVVWLDHLERAAPEDLGCLPPLLRATMVLLSGEPVAPDVDALPRAEPITRIRLAPLPTTAARAAARDALGRVGEGPADAPHVARESGGNPRRVEELAAAIAGGGARTSAAVLEARLHDLPAAGGRLLEVLAAARTPIPHAVARDAAGLAAIPLDLGSLIARMAAARLLRTRGLGAADPVEIHDEAVRAAVQGLLAPPVLAQIQLALAGALHRWAAAGAATPRPCSSGSPGGNSGGSPGS